MPIYTFENKNTEEQQTIEMSMTDREKWLEENKDWFQVIGSMSIGDPVKLGVTKNPKHLEFQKYVLPKIKAANPLGNIGNGRWDLKREI